MRMVTGDGRLAAASASPEVQGMDRRIATGHVTGLFQGEVETPTEQFRLRWNDPVASGTTFHQPYDRSEFGFSTRRRPASPPTSSTRTFPPLTPFCERTKDISPLLIYILCLKSVGSWSLLVMVPAERSALRPILTPVGRVCALWCVKVKYANGIFVLRRNLDLLVDRLLEGNIP